MKESELRAKKFEERFGAGATELDALEALHPGELRRIVLGYIRRYYDIDLGQNVQAVVDEVEDDIDDVMRDVRARHADEIAALEQDRKAVTEAIGAELARVQQLIDEKEKAFEERARPILEAIKSDLDHEAPDTGDYDWPEPADGDEVADPLFDSTRSYLDQVERYHLHQGKTTIKTLREFSCTCTQCGKSFTSSRSTTRFCDKGCDTRWRRSREARHADAVSFGAPKAEAT